MTEEVNSTPLVLLWSVIFLWEASSFSHLRLHCSPVTFTSLEILLNSLAVLLNMSFLVAFPFPELKLLLLPATDKKFYVTFFPQFKHRVLKDLWEAYKQFKLKQFVTEQFGMVLKMSKY